MADGIVQVAPDSTGKKVDTTELTVGANTVERQRVHLSGTAAAALVEPINSTPTGSEYGVPTRPVALPLPAGASTETTLAALSTKTPALGIAAPSASSPVTLPNDVTVGAAASVAAINVDLLTGTTSGWYDAANAHSCSIQIVGAAGISAGAITFEQTNDTSAASAGNVWAVEEITSLTPTPNIAAVTIAASTTRMFAGAVMARYVRVRVSTAFAGGNVQAIGIFSQLPYQRSVQTVHQATAANANVTATISGSPTVNTITTMPALVAGTAAIGDVGTQYRANATGAASISSVLSPATPAGASIKASAGRLIGYQLVNSSAAVRSVKLFNATAVTMGTTAAVFEIDLAAGQRADLQLPGGIGFATGIMWAVTSGKGLTDNTTTGLAVNDVSGAFFFA